MLITSLAGAALVIRILILLLFSNTEYWTGIWSDAGTYNQWAHRIVVDHDWLGKEPFFMTPLYPYFLAIVYSVFGFTFFPVRIIQLLVGSGTVLGIYFIGERLLSRKAAFIAGCIAAVYGPFLLSNNLILVETLKVFFLVFSVLFFVIASERSDLRLWIVSGIVVGLASLCRPTDLLILLPVGIWLWTQKPLRLRERVLRLGATVLGVAIIVAPVTLRNYVVSGETVLITSNGGFNFYLGNNPKAIGVYSNVDEIDLVNDPDGRAFAEAAVGRPLRHSEVSAYYNARAFDYVTGQPFGFLRLLGVKAILFFNRREIGQTGYDYQFIAKTAIPLLSYLPTFSIVGPLALLGCAVAFRNRRKLLLLYGVLAVEFLGVILFFVTDRFRLSAMPFLILFAGAGIAMMHDQWKAHDWKRLRISVLVLFVGVLVVNVLNYEIKDEFSMEYAYLGKMRFDARQFSSAMDAYRQALTYRDTYPLHNSIGNVYLATGNSTAALKEFKTGALMDPRQPFSVFGEGSVYASQQQWEPALEAYTRAIEISPRYTSAYLNKGLTLYFLQRYPESLKTLEQYTQLEPDRSKLVTVYKDIENLKAIIARGGPGDTNP